MKTRKETPLEQAQRLSDKEDRRMATKPQPTPGPKTELLKRVNRAMKVFDVPQAELIKGVLCNARQ